jgi:iron-sulfur cluster repair protein YtfE (RIC family)
MSNSIEAGNPGLVEHFTGMHRACDALWSQVEEAVEAKDGEKVASYWGRFDASLRRHLAMEEEVIFPAFEQATGMFDSGPTHVMRSEHRQMRGVLDQMATAFAAEDYPELLDQGDTLLMVIQQHNVKEEGMLYPMAEERLAAQWPDLRQRLLAYEQAE